MFLGTRGSDTAVVGLTRGPDEVAVRTFGSGYAEAAGAATWVEVEATCAQADKGQAIAPIPTIMLAGSATILRIVDTSFELE